MVHTPCIRGMCGTPLDLRVEAGVAPQLLPPPPLPLPPVPLAVISPPGFHDTLPDPQSQAGANHRTYNRQHDLFTVLNHVCDVQPYIRVSPWHKPSARPVYLIRIGTSLFCSTRHHACRPLHSRSPELGPPLASQATFPKMVCNSNPNPTPDPDPESAPHLQATLCSLHSAAAPPPPHTLPHQHGHQPCGM